MIAGEKNGVAIGDVFLIRANKAAGVRKCALAAAAPTARVASAVLAASSRCH